MKRIFQILSAVRTRRRVCTGIFGIMLMLPTGCISRYGDFCHCEICLYIVTETENADFDDALEGAGLFLFDNNRAYASSALISAADIAENVPARISYKQDNIPMAVVWGNLADGERVSPESTGAAPENMFIYFAEDVDGYAVGADNLFFGAKQLAGKNTESIVISPKTGRLTITVKGLAGFDRSDEYYFTVETPYNGYDFDGNPLSGSATLKLDGVFQGDDLVAAEACRLFHFPATGAEGKSLIVELYQRIAGTDGAQLWAAADSDADGNPVVILREQTTNLLINFTGTGNLEILVVITDWDETHQWDDW